MSTSSMSPRDRFRLCCIVGRLIYVDERLAKPERVFLDTMIRHLGLPPKARQAVWKQAQSGKDQRQDIERLRRSGEAARLLDMLRRAAGVDGEVDPREAAMIHRVEEVIRLRLGAEDFPLRLECLSRAPLGSRYQILEVLGEGGFATIFKARRVGSQQIVVIKRLKVELEETLEADERAQVEDRFWREVKIISELKSPYSVRWIDAGFDVNAPYMVLEYVTGRTLGAVLREDGPLAPRVARRLMHQVLEAIEEAHEQGVIHRDLKPDNIMVTGHGRRLDVRVLDYGLAGVMDKLQRSKQTVITTDGQTVGTSLSTKRVENDLYALGLILCECLTGKRAVQAGSHFDALRWQLSEAEVELPRGILETGFGPIIRRACRKPWQARFHSARAMREALDAVEIADAELRLSPQPVHARRAPSVAILGSLLSSVAGIALMLVTFLVMVLAL